jgi:hypothetical protein
MVWAPIFDRLGTPTSTAADVTGFLASSAVADIGAGWTVTNYRGFHFQEPGGSGTVTNQVAVDVEALTQGSTLRAGIRNASNEIKVPNSTTLASASTTITADRAYQQFTLTPSGTTTMTGNPFLSNGFAAGQEIILDNVDATPTDCATLTDHDTAASGLQLLVPSRTLCPADPPLYFIYDGTDWFEIGGGLSTRTKSYWVTPTLMQAETTNSAKCTGPLPTNGHLITVITNDDAALGVNYFEIAMPDSYTGGSITAEIHQYNENASPSGNFVYNFGCNCVRGGSDVITTVYGSTTTCTNTFSTQYREEHCTTASFTPQGTCQGGVTLYCRFFTNTASTTTTQAANSCASTDIYMLGVKIEYPVLAMTD